jgi:hypothetical protein
MLKKRIDLINKNNKKIKIKKMDNLFKYDYFINEKTNLKKEKWFEIIKELRPLLDAIQKLFNNFNKCKVSYNNIRFWKNGVAPKQWEDMRPLIKIHQENDIIKIHIFDDDNFNDEDNNTESLMYLLGWFLKKLLEDYVIDFRIYNRLMEIDIMKNDINEIIELLNDTVITDPDEELRKIKEKLNDNNKINYIIDPYGEENWDEKKWWLRCNKHKG